MLDPEAPDTHSWSLGASDGDHTIRLDAMDEGLTRLVASLPTDEAEAKGTPMTCLRICHSACWCCLAVIAPLCASVHLGASHICNRAADQSHQAVGIRRQARMFWLLLTQQCTLSLVTKWAVYMSVTVYMRVRCTAM